jgi:hypothetical protein
MLPALVKALTGQSANGAQRIHELGHVMTITGFQEDAGIPKAGKANDKLVDQNCRSLIEGLQ